MARLVQARSRTSDTASTSTPTKPKTGPRKARPIRPGADRVTRLPSFTSGYSASSCAAIETSSAWAFSLDTPGFSRPWTKIGSTPRSSSHSRPTSIWACIAIGNQISGAAIFSVPSNPWSATPTIV